ncbi:hypothetical protein KP509_30G045300 [Ceratopteris richardii]|uniref:Protein kinase domain-containing protein n=1 Tax=Ceratopteris richardii TaxID=49495 RepID=A0A8T2R4C3_CERRI|nr:hypothetical protein KP509_30G045300 [Ceratopteris richardii]
MDGGTLADLLIQSGGHLGESLVRHYTRCIVRGLHYLHGNGIVHCDIKGQNILIGSTGVKIADFGAAKRMKPSDDNRGTGQSGFKGTPLWMAPEVVQGLEQGFAADIWSLGCTVVEMIQGRPPWGRNITDMAAALYKLGCSEEDPPLPQSIWDDARDFLLHCLQRNPKDRWTASQLLQHPFLRAMELTEDDEAKHAQSSPRSILECISSDNEAYERVDDSTAFSFSSDGYFVPEQHFVEDMSRDGTGVPKKKRLPDAFKSEKCEWITVKRTLSTNRVHQEVPFMEPAIERELQVKKACYVSLNGAMFLRNRKTVG